jgi:hypothetical protein
VTGNLPLDPDVGALVEDVFALATLARGYGEQRWADELDRHARWTQVGDRHGLTRLLGLFGGMGSLNDLVFHPQNGNAADEAEAVVRNERFQDLLARVQCRARELDRESR